MQKTNHDADKLKQRFEMWGWIVFLACAVCFILSYLVTSPNWFGLIASVLFLIGCVVFIAPFVINRPGDK